MLSSSTAQGGPVIADSRIRERAAAAHSRGVPLGVALAPEGVYRDADTGKGQEGCKGL